MKAGAIYRAFALCRKKITLSYTSARYVMAQSISVMMQSRKRAALIVRRCYAVIEAFRDHVALVICCYALSARAFMPCFFCICR